MDTETKPNANVAAELLRSRIQRMFQRSLHVRHVDAGSCNACESEIKLLTNPYYDVHRLGIFFTPSPRHADLLLVTGPVTHNMEEALRITYEAMPDPRLVIAVGACACSGGIFGSSYLSNSGVADILPVDVYVPGCPPPPLALIHSLLMAIGRAETKVQRMQVNAQGARTPAAVFSPVPKAAAPRVSSHPPAVLPAEGRNSDNLALQSERGNADKQGGAASSEVKR